MKAIVVQEGNAVVQDGISVPELRAGHVLVKTEAVGLNPTDWKHAAWGLTAEGGRLGCDFAGSIVDLGAEVSDSWNIGDRVCGVIHGGNIRRPEDGAFAEYTLADSDLLIKIPPAMPFEEAATFGLGAVTVGQGLYQQGLRLDLTSTPSPQGEKIKLLIYGGSTASGALGIQYATISGYSVYTTCSPDNFEYVKSLGAVAAFDYNDSDAISLLRDELGGKNLRFAWDTIASEASIAFCMQALSKGPGCRYASIKFPAPEISVSGVEVVGTLMYSVFGEAFEKKGRHFPASSEDHDFAKFFLAYTEILLHEGRLTPHRVKVGSDGLVGVLNGLQMMREGQVRGQGSEAGLYCCEHSDESLKLLS